NDAEGTWQGEGAGGDVAWVPQMLHGQEHIVTGDLLDARVPVEQPRDGQVGDTCGLGDLAHARSVSGGPCAHVQCVRLSVLGRRDEPWSPAPRRRRRARSSCRALLIMPDHPGSFRTGAGPVPGSPGKALADPVRFIPGNLLFPVTFRARVPVNTPDGRWVNRARTLPGGQGRSPGSPPLRILDRPDPTPGAERTAAVPGVRDVAAPPREDTAVGHEWRAE